MWLSTYLYNGKYGVRTDETGLYYMRSRYYNVTIKRFINAETERGNITNGKSLNRYSYVQGNPVSYTDPYGLSPLDNPSAMAHILFGLLGVVPGVVGATADFANAILYFMEGKNTEGVISLIGGFASLLGLPCFDKMIKAEKFGKYSADIARITKLMSNSASLLINGENTYKQSLDMYHKYFVDKKGVSAETAAELAFLAASIAGTYFSLKGIKGAVDEWRIKGGSVKLSKKNMQHIKKHTFKGMYEQSKHLNDDQLQKKLSKNTFFNKDWSDKKIKKYTQKAYNILKKQNKTGLHSVEIKNETIYVFINDKGEFDTAYGVYKYSIEDFRQGGK